ncbi:hypothetical protein AB0I37_24955 [Micromonospora purpureochromogenes]|uniref:hypothetical protein n=1 Tax=Micromonospora purpureochromogenes TaxID=47872 RepID=UPI0033D0F76E
MTSSLLGVRRGSQTPRVSTYPRADYSSGPDVADLAEAAGLILDPWQRYVLDHGLGEQPDGKWSAREVACFVPRQSGKGAVIEARVLAGLFLFGERRILWSAHEYKTAQEGFLRIKDLIQNAPDFNALVKRYWEGSGEQGIELTTGQRLKFIARSKGSGRGFSGDLVILDEAQELTLLQMKALFSTMSAKSIEGNPQVWYFGTPPESPTAWCYGLREDGERGKSRLAYFDWGLGDVNVHQTEAEQLAEYADRDLWYRANPALGIRISEEFCEDELSRLRSGFAAERLGMWQPRATSGSGVISDEVWRGLVDERAVRPASVVFAVVVNSRRTHTAIAAVGPRADGTLLASIVDYRPGTQWVAERLAELKRRHNPLAIVAQDKGPTGTLLTAFADQGITQAADRHAPKRGDLVVPWATELAIAYGLFLDAVHQGRLFHLDEGPLNAALAVAETRALSGGTAWDFGDPAVAPLLAVTEATWGALTVKTAARRRSAYEDEELMVV